MGDKISEDWRHEVSVCMTIMAAHQLPSLADYIVALTYERATPEVREWMDDCPINARAFLGEHKEVAEKMERIQGDATIACCNRFLEAESPNSSAASLAWGFADAAANEVLTLVGELVSRTRPNRN